MKDLLYNAIPLVVLASLFTAIFLAGKTPLWAEAYRRLRRNKIAILAMTVISLYGLVATLDSIGYTDKKSDTRISLIDQMFTKFRENPERNYSEPRASMTFGEAEPHALKYPGEHLLGTDGNGNDVVYKVLKGARTSFIIGGLTTLMATPIALLFGLMAGYYGKKFFIDDIIAYIYTVISSIPSILLQIALVLVLDKGLVQICIALGITRWVGMCRLVRGETMKHREREYVRAAQSLGVSDIGILWKHILPNLLPVVIISVTLGISGLMLSEAILSYLGIGVDASTGSWGNMIDSARDELAREPAIWWNFGSASVALFILVLAFNFLGDALRDAVDPRLRS
jgi:peptide/nickel transport system permease protein